MKTDNEKRRNVSLSLTQIKCSVPSLKGKKKGKSRVYPAISITVHFLPRKPSSFRPILIAMNFDQSKPPLTNRVLSWRKRPDVSCRLRETQFLA